MAILERSRIEHCRIEHCRIIRNLLLAKREAPQSVSDASMQMKAKGFKPLAL